MKTGDKIATVIFWLVAGGTGLFIGVMLMYWSFEEIWLGRLSYPNWPALGIGVVFLGLTFAGVWQCIRTVSNSEKRKDAATKKTSQGT
jgi:hypothetical protein